MKVALYDRLPADRLDLYADALRWPPTPDKPYRTHDREGVLTVNDRFRQHDDDTDLVLVTHTRLRRATTCPVVLVGTATEAVQHLAVDVYRAPHWSAHAVAAYVLTNLLAHADLSRPVLVSGRGLIARLVVRWLRRYRPVRGRYRPPYGAVVLATPAHGRPPTSWLLHDMADTVMVSVTRTPPPWRAVETAVQSGLLSRVVADVAGRDWLRQDAGPTWLQLTGHRAWDGHHSDRRRVQSVLRVLELAQAGRLTDLRRVSTFGAVQTQWVQP